MDLYKTRVRLKVFIRCCTTAVSGECLVGVWKLSGSGQEGIGKVFRKQTSMILKQELQSTCQSIFFWTKNFLEPKFGLTQIFLDKKFIVDLKFFFYPNFFGHKIFLGPKIFLVTQKFLRTQLFFRPDIFFGPDILYKYGHPYRTYLSQNFSSKLLLWKKYGSEIPYLPTIWTYDQNFVVFFLMLS